MSSSMIPVAFTPDENYIVPMGIAILSMLYTKKAETKYYFYIVLSDRFKEEASILLNQILDKIKSIESEFCYEIIYIDADIFQNQKITTKHLTVNAYYRLLLADVIKKHEKCMYFDCDVLMTEDLQEMFQIDLGDNYVAGVKAIARHQNTPRNNELIKKYNFPSFDNYIYSGNLILNLSKIREDNLMDQFLEHMTHDYPSEDQDVINYCCYGKIKFLPLKFCMLNRWINNNAIDIMENQIHSFQEIAEARRAPMVVHFAGSITKPWCNLRTAYGDVWWKYAREILNESEYLKLYKSAEEDTVKRDWAFLKKELKKGRSIILFGFGEIGKELAGVILQWGYELKCFVDNDIKKQGHCYNGYSILDLKSALNNYDDIVFLISSPKYRQEIRQQLLREGVAADRIVEYYKKDEIYYLALDPKFFEYEFGDLCIKEYGWKTYW